MGLSTAAKGEPDAILGWMHNISSPIERVMLGFSCISRVFGILPKTLMRCDIMPNANPIGILGVIEWDFRVFAYEKALKPM